MREETKVVKEANEVASIAVNELVRLLSERGVVVDPKDQQTAISAGTDHVFNAIFVGEEDDESD
ncbi:hypothetical protein CL630_00310 [bacterium]|nr:hypothetical protein [bacterium]